jgi:hypothetical protein
VKVGDVVKRSGDEKHTWVVDDIKSDSRAFWIKIDEKDTHDVWYEASYFEVISESR